MPHLTITCATARVAGSIPAASGIALALLALSSCASVRQISWQRLDGVPCQTSKLNPAWYSSETVTFCFENGKALLVPTNHDDAVGIMGGLIGAVTGAVVGTQL